jgi:hypothetical protein
MKKTLATLTIVAGLALSSFGQGYLFFDSSYGGTVSINGVLDTGTDVNLALVNQTLGTTVATLLLSDTTAAGDITANADGTIFDNGGAAWSTGTAGTAYNFIVEGWLTGDTYQFGASGNGQSTPFSVTVLSSTAIPPANIINMPSFNIPTVPEPSTLALAGIGAALLVIRRRK